MAVDLFAGIPVTDYQAALAWYQRLLGSEPAFFPNARVYRVNGSGALSVVGCSVEQDAVA
jgi:catechol 2,3-dioxygenase-like lactoylglutathione lyase family enzyme